MIYKDDYHLPETDTDRPLTEGWHRPQNAHKWHYYTKDRRSLCGKWVLFGGVILAENQSRTTNEEDCSKCVQRRKLLLED